MNLTDLIIIYIMAYFSAITIYLNEELRLLTWLFVIFCGVLFGIKERCLKNEFKRKDEVFK